MKKISKIIIMAMLSVAILLFIPWVSKASIKGQGVLINNIYYVPRTK